MAGACECGNEPSGCINFGGFLDQLRTCWLLRKDCATWSLLEGRRLTAALKHSVAIRTSDVAGHQGL